MKITSPQSRTHLDEQIHVRNAKPLIHLQGVSKDYFGSTVLHKLDFDIYAGEVHALFGENGAGKSTLLKMITGDIQPSSGHIFINDEEIKIASVHHAKELGINAVFQEYTLVPQLTVEENLFLGSNLSSGIFLQKTKLREWAKKTLDRLEFDLEPNQLIMHLSHAQQRMVEIAKAFHSKPAIMILDEPTAALSGRETKQLFAMIDVLKNEGIGVVYVSHRTSEIFRLSDRVSVLKDGHLVCTETTPDIDEDQLIELAFGHRYESFFPTIKTNTGRELLNISNLSLSNSLVQGVSLTVNAGEIVGLTGLAGSGAADIARACFGLNQIKSGVITYLDDQVYNKNLGINDLTPRAMLDRGMLYLPADRRNEGLIMDHNIRQNISLPSLSLAKFSTGFWVRKKGEKHIMESVSRRLKINQLSIENVLNHLSGGTQQKVMLAKGFVRDVQLFILDEPTIGVDIGTRAEIYRLMQEFCDAGASILLISSDLSEVANIVHRVYIVDRGELLAEIPHKSINEATLSHYLDQREAPCHDQKTS
ncbi:MAG: sugar ABC transporter ATP-binding protein [Pseudomonadales bacterium]|nr:sugar ABC transporter ATP-binding protein [Pseudomonadales bacterium]